MVNRLYPFAGRTLALDGLRMHYLDEGAGEPLVMVHGNPTWSAYFRHLVLALRDEYRCVVPDHIGCGRSEKPPLDRYPYTLERRVADLEAFLDRLGLTHNLTLVLHDWGGMIGMAYACRHPERVARLVLMNTAAFGLPAGKPFPWPLWLVRNTPFGSFLVRRLNLFSLTASVVGCTRRPMPPGLRRLYLEPYDSWDHRLAVLRFVQDIPLTPGDPSYELVRSVEDALPRLRDVPMLLCWGSRDFVFDDRFLAEWRRRFPAAEVLRLGDAGHYVLEDAPQAVCPRVRRFLLDHPLAAAHS